VYLELVRRAASPKRREWVERKHGPLGEEAPRVKVVAFYRPPSPVVRPAGGDREGAADWTDVSGAVPQYVGHDQPRFPGELGYYDYRIVGVLRRQTELAAQYGIHAFCFDLRSRDEGPVPTPLECYLADQTPALRFCVCSSDAGLHSPPTVAAAGLRDARYLRVVDGRPLLLLNPPATSGDGEAMVRRWRAHARTWGVGDIFVAVVLAAPEASLPPGADAAIEAPPLAHADRVPAARRVRLANPRFAGIVLEYRTVADHACNLPPSDSPRIRTVVPSWDSEPEKPGRGCSLLNATPDRYRRWLAAAMTYAREHPVAGDSYVFVNGWNNWAEGAYLEPDRRYGYAFLQATRDASTSGAPLVVPQAADAPPVVIVHAFYPDLLPEMLAPLVSWGLPYELHVTALAERADEIRARLAGAGVEATLHSVENRGRDILPFLRVARQVPPAGDRLILKLHTKRSPHRGDGAAWRRDLTKKLLAPESAARIAEAMRGDRRIGIVAPEGHVLSLRSYWGANRARVQELAYRMGLPPVSPEQQAFVGGSMFWSRMAALMPLLKLDLDDDDFEPETGQVDGTLAHAIERAFTLSTLRAGLWLTESNDPRTEVAEGRRRYVHAPDPEETSSRLPRDFDPTAYLRANPDVLATGQDPAEHYLTLGRFEGRRW
jgi:lipopolysaccharide biosynthesis protein